MDNSPQATDELDNTLHNTGIWTAGHTSTYIQGRQLATLDEIDIMTKNTDKQAVTHGRQFSQPSTISTVEKLGSLLQTVQTTCLPILTS
jgi:hypothetical protein